MGIVGMAVYKIREVKNDWSIEEMSLGGDGGMVFQTIREVK